MPRLRDLFRSNDVPKGLHHCPRCRTSFMCPIEWETDGDEHWLMRLRCGECGIWRRARATNAEAKELDLVLNAQEGQIRRALARIDREQMEAELDVFVGALQRDLIDAGDFAP
jgi:hypothetical protein